MTNHYETLGVEKNASDNTIKQAYKKLAKQYHPDMSTGNETKFKKINEAYETLKNPETRRAYDNPRPEGFHFHRGGVNMEDVFADFNVIFGQGMHPRQRQYRQKNRDLSVNISITLEELYKQEEKHISIKLSTGERELVKINIPATIQSGQRIRYTELGDNAHQELTRGDLYVIIHIENHKQFEKKGLDLYTTLTIDCLDAITGTEKIVQTLTGKNLKVKIPTSTQFGTVLNLNGEGMKYKNASGNMLIQVLVKIPENLTDDDLELIKQIKH